MSKKWLSLQKNRWSQIMVFLEALQKEMDDLEACILNTTTNIPR